MPEENEDIKLVIVVRNDLKLRKGKLAVQVAHAAVDCAFITWSNNRHLFTDWYSSWQKKVVVKVDTLEDLLRLEAIAEVEGLEAMLVTDMGLTQLPPDTVTCLGIGPANSTQLAHLTGDLKLL